MFIADITDARFSSGAMAMLSRGLATLVDICGEAGGERIDAGHPCTRQLVRRSSTLNPQHAVRTTGQPPVVQRRRPPTYYG
jgi:hypothetical protein